MARYAKREFQVGRYWLDQREGSPAWYRCWIEGRRTHRASLNTADRAEAERLLTELFIREHSPVQQAPQEEKISDVLDRYQLQYGHTLRSAAFSRAAVEHWKAYWKEDRISALADVKRQEAFHAVLRGKGMVDSSLMRTITVGKAALNRAYKRGELQSVPYILTVKAGQGEPMGRPLDLEEVKALYQHAQPHLKVFIAWMLGTGARPEAILDLHSRQVEWDDGLVHLNPPGRKQTKKHRPIVRLIPSLAGCVFDGPLIVAKSSDVKSIKKAWQAARKAAGLDSRVTPYSLRHTAARWMRRQGVSNDEVGQQIGHRRLGTTAVYTEYDPAYLQKASDALDALVRASCAPLPIRQKFTAIRNGEEIERDRWWAM